MAAPPSYEDRKRSSPGNSDQHSLGLPRAGKHDELRKKLRHGQVKNLSKVATRGTGPLDWMRTTIADVYYYMVVWFPRTWWLTMTGLPNVLFEPLSFMTTIIFAIGTTFILFCTLIVSVLWNLPWVQNIWRPYSAKKGVGLGNMAYPQIFEYDQDPMNKRIKDAAFAVMSDPLGPNAHPSTSNERIFDLEVSKLLMMLAALVYERDIGAYHDAARMCVHTHKKDKHVATENGTLTNDGLEIEQQLRFADRKIEKVAEAWGLKYASVSELATNTSPLCGAFWNPDFNFIILAFKGTNPVEFKEWAIDMTFDYTDGRGWLPGFTKVHSGFYNQIFPQSLNHATGTFPYTDIRSQVAQIAAEIRATTGKDHVNLYVTGHSLGAALACLFYARAVAKPRDFGLNENERNQVIVRDAYCFGTPIVGDPDCISAFGQAIHDQNLDNPPTLWRVTNRRDAVATMLPEGGDYDMLRHIGPSSQLHFAHIGQEIQLTTNDHKVCQGPGTLLPERSSVCIVSHLQKGGAGPDVELPGFYRLLQSIPIVRRFAVHMPSSYWDRLTKVQDEYDVEFRSSH